MIPFNDLSRRVATRRKALERAFGRVLDSGKFILGRSVETFEREFARYCGVRHGVGVASGTDAIWLALEGLGVGKGDEVITVANTCAPTISAILKCGATPVLVDIDPATMTMDPEHVETAVSRRTRCILPVHLYGQCADMRPLREIARRRGLFLVEDCAQAHGATYRGRRAGSLGDAGCFSFYPTKNLGCLGDGGMIVTNDGALAERLRLLRQYGYSRPNVPTTTGHNSRLDELQAAFLSESLPALDSSNARRRDIGLQYTSALRNFVTVPIEASYGKPSYHLYVIRVQGRLSFQDSLAKRGIGTAVHYPMAIHKQKGYGRKIRVSSRGLRQTERAIPQVLSLPLYPELTDPEANLVIKTVLATVKVRA